MNEKCECDTVGQTITDWSAEVDVICNADGSGATVYLDKCAFNSAGHDLTNIYLDSRTGDLAVNQLADDSPCYGVIDYSNEGMRYKFNVVPGTCGSVQNGTSLTASLFMFSGAYSENVYRRVCKSRVYG